MLIVRAFFLVLALILCGEKAFSEQPHDKKNDKATAAEAKQSEQNKTVPNPAKTPAAAAISAIPDNISKASASHQQQNPEPENWADIFRFIPGFLSENWDKVIASIFSGLLAWFTYLLWRSTHNLWAETKAAGGTALIAANAAKKSADALILVERAYVKMSHHPPGVQIREHDFWVAITIKNFGHTPARVIDVVVQSRCLLPGEVMPDVPQYNRPKDLVASKSFLVADEELSFAYVPDESIDVDALKNGTETLYVFGYVDYIDAFKVKHRAGYGRRYGREWNDRSRYGNDSEYAKRSNLIYMHELHYNYDRPRKKGEGNDWDEQAPS